MPLLDLDDSEDLATLTGHLDLAAPLELVDDVLDANSRHVSASAALVVCDLLHNVKSFTALVSASISDQGQDVLITELQKVLQSYGGTESNILL